MSYGSQFKKAVLPLVLSAVADGDSFSDRRGAGRNAFSMAWEVFDAFACAEVKRGAVLPDIVFRAHADGAIGRFWDINTNTWADEYGVYDISVSKLASYLSSPYTALVQVAAMGMYIDAIEKGNPGVISITSDFLRSCHASLTDKDACLESGGDKHQFGLPYDLGNTEAGTGQKYYEIAAQWLMNNFGAHIGQPPRGFKRILEHYDPKYNPKGLGTNTSPIADGTISAPLNKGESMEDDVKSNASAKSGVNSGSQATTDLSVVAASLKGLDGPLRGAIDGMLAASGIGNTKILVEAVEAAASGQARVKVAEGKAAAFEAELIAAKSRLAKLASSASSMATGPVKVTGSSSSVPDGTVELKNAADVFDIPKEAAKLFDFDIPVGVWDFAHPHVPSIDHDYVFDAEILVTMLIAIRKNQVPWLKGHTGTGKTTMIEQIYARLNLPVFRVNLDSDVSRGDLVGREVLTTDAAGKTITKFVDGVIPMAMSQPCCLLLDEIDASRPDLGFVLQRLTEGAGFMLLEDGGRTVEPHPYFRIAATANTNGRGDETGLYSGTRALGVALLNRFKPFIDVEYMTQPEEEALIQDRVPGIPVDTAKRIAAYATEHRKAFIASSVTLPNSPRDTIAMAWAFTDFHMFGPDRAMQLAFKHCILAAADADDRQVLLGLAQRVFPDAVTKGLKA